MGYVLNSHHSPKSMDPLDLAIAAARAAGSLLRSHFGTALNVNALEAHDIKLELDVQSQTLITGMVLDQVPGSRDLWRGRDRRQSIEPVPLDHRSHRRHGELLLRHPAFLHLHRAPREHGHHPRRHLRSDPRRTVAGAQGRSATCSTASRAPSAPAPRISGSDPLRRLLEDEDDHRHRPPALPGPGLSRAQMPPHGQRRARHGVRRLRPAGRLYRAIGQPLGHRRRDPSGRVRRRFGEN